jgi:NIPSNAP
MLMHAMSPNAVALPLLLLLHLSSAESTGWTGPQRTVRERTIAMQWPIVELRQYTLLPGKRDDLIELFEAEFIESQEAVGLKLIGQFRDLDKPDRFVWLRAFKDMASRAEALKRFYDGPVWKSHREAANATMVDSDNVLLLRVSRLDSGFHLEARTRAPKGAPAMHGSLIIATIYYFAAPIEPDLATFFEATVRPHLEAVGLPVLASFVVTESSPNNFPRLPVRENEHVFVWFTKAADQGDYERQVAQLSSSLEWKTVSTDLQRKLMAPPEVLRLEPTARSQLRD